MTIGLGIEGINQRLMVSINGENAIFQRVSKILDRYITSNSRLVILYLVSAGFKRLKKKDTNTVSELLEHNFNSGIRCIN